MQARTTIAAAAVNATCALVGSLALFCLDVHAQDTTRPRWQTLPATPALPKAERSGYAPLHGIKINQDVLRFLERTKERGHAGVDLK
jgi:hypothetical protein